MCCQTAAQCATQIADKTFTCSNSVSSQFNRLIKICSKNQPAGCGSKTNINLNSLGEKQQIDATAIPVGASCSYRVMSKCGFPAFDLNNTNIDVTVINQAGGSETVDDLPDNATLSASDAAVPRAANGVVSYIAGNPTEKDASCGKMRKMFVTVTNVPPAATNSTRLLQAGAQSFSLAFTATDGPVASSSSVVSVVAKFVVVLSSLIYLAF